ncbi:hypothetical protein UFOVP699_17 [uncultured Caudovirales phage]|uniref:Uncharacterized protein n=1 Tax=uncultured Caudovirales phage TaxID=2100421 RepID=A0A6J5NTR2_9CAUD|nr:hypothetical protein UFOVP699_17 [uncultured Caudovirales phage]
MAFLPVSLPIQEILLTNFVTDIATISNSNDLLLQAKLEDLINNLEIDITNLSIGTDNAINYIKTQSVIIQDQGFIYQTGNPNQIIAKLEKNISNQSIFTVDILNVNSIAGLSQVTLNDLTVNTSLTIDGATTFNNPVTVNSSFIESKEVVTVDLESNSPEAKATITLSNTSRQNIFVRLKATTAPTLNPVYTGTVISPGLTNIALYIDFDATNPPAQNTVFTIHILDIVEATTQTSIISAVNTATLPLRIKPGVNQSTSTNIVMHNNSNSVGVNPASTVTPNKTVAQYGNNATFEYIIDQTLLDRLIIKSMVAMELF